MQVFKCMKKAQNLIEFMLIFPILLMATLVILETALYWQDVNAVYNLNSEINANLALTEPGSQSWTESCAAADNAIKYLEGENGEYNKIKAITMANPEFTKNVIDGKEPFSLYKYEIKADDKPLVTLWIDCRNPFEEGYTTQIDFYHKTLIVSASIPTLKGEPIVVIPKNIHIASPKESTLRHY